MLLQSNFVANLLVRFPNQLAFGSDFPKSGGDPVYLGVALPDEDTNSIQSINNKSLNLNKYHFLQNYILFFNPNYFKTFVNDILIFSIYFNICCQKLRFLSNKFEHIDPFTRVNQDHLHSVIQFALDKTESDIILQAFPFHARKHAILYYALTCKPYNTGQFDDTMSGSYGRHF